MTVHENKNPLPGNSKDAVISHQQAWTTPELQSIDMRKTALDNSTLMIDDGGFNTGAVAS